MPNRPILAFGWNNILPQLKPELKACCKILCKQIESCFSVNNFSVRGLISWLRQIQRHHWIVHVDLWFYESHNRKRFMVIDIHTHTQPYQCPDGLWIWIFCIKKSGLWVIRLCTKSWKHAQRDHRFGFGILQFVQKLHSICSTFMLCEKLVSWLLRSGDILLLSHVPY